MGFWERCAEEDLALEKERDYLKDVANDREIGIIAQGEVATRISEIDKKLGNEK